MHPKHSYYPRKKPQKVLKIKILIPCMFLIYSNLNIQLWSVV